VPRPTIEFVASLIKGAEAEPVVNEHLPDQEGELFLHLLMGDLRRFAIAAFDRGDADLLNQFWRSSMLDCTSVMPTWRTRSRCLRGAHGVGGSRDAAIHRGMAWRSTAEAQRQTN
jgi:hypothetical protein